MTEAEARAEADRLKRERPEFLWSVRERAPGFWEVVGASVPARLDRGELRPTVAPPPQRPDPSQDVVRPPINPDYLAP